jgi:hypothetical protein
MPNIKMGDMVDIKITGNSLNSLNGDVMVRELVAG